MTISYTHELPMGHRLMRHKSRCRFLHGHNYLITVRVSGTPDSETGMVLDFHDLKVAVRDVLEKYDHSFVLEQGDHVLDTVPLDYDTSSIIYLPYPPTAEMLAQHWKKELETRLDRKVSIRVDETQMCGVSV